MRKFALLFIVSPLLLLADAAPEFSFAEKTRTRARASSTLIEKRKPRSYYAAHRAVDRKLASAWCTGRNNGIGESLKLKFAPTPAVALYIFNGYGASRRLYNANHRVKDVDIVLTMRSGRKRKIRKRLSADMCQAGDDRECFALEGADNKKCMRRIKRLCFLTDGGRGASGSEVNLIKPACLTGIEIRIRSVYPGNKYKDTCIAEVIPVQPGADKTPPPAVRKLFDGCR